MHFVGEKFKTVIDTFFLLQLVLGRRLLNELLTNYLPTFLICLVSFSTTYYNPNKHFEVDQLTF